MVDFERILGCLFALYIGAVMLAPGLAILRRRPVVIAPTTMAGVLTLPFLLGLITNTVGLIMGSLNSDFAVMSSALSSLVLLVILVGFFAIVAAQYFYLYNITETMLRDALHSALQKQGLLYSEPEPGFFARLYGMFQIRITMPESRASIKVIVHRGNAWMRIVGKRHIPNYKALIADFEQFLTANECGNSIGFGVFLIIGGIIFIAMGISSLVRAFT